MEINRNAPAKATAETTIYVPPAKVWAILADINDWPRWNPDVSRAELEGALLPGATFRWKAGGLPIVSKLREVEPERRIAWTGRALTIRAVHVWTLEPREEGVVVRTEESFEGILARLLAGPMCRLLAESLEKSLAALKAECER